MRFLCPLVRMFSLFLLMSISPSAIFADSTSAPESPARRVQIQCTILRARVTDVDAFGFNFDVALPKHDVPASDSALSDAHIARGVHVDELLSDLTDTEKPNHYSALTAPILTVQDGKSGLISLPRLSDPGLSKTPWLFVTPDIHDDGTVTLLISPLFQFVQAPGSHGDPPATTTEGFPVTVTVSNGNMMMFTEEPRPVPGTDLHPTVGGLPIIRSSSGHIRNMDSTELWIFLTVTVMPDTPAPISPTESMRHA